MLQISNRLIVVRKAGRPIHAGKTLLRQAKRKLFGPVPRSQKDYATHIPVLLGMSQALDLKSVLELGCGENSTLTFLNRSVFPSLATLDSVENDPLWLQKLSTIAGIDSRLRLQLTRGAIHSAIEKTDLEGYDLIFVDDSATSEERAETIRAISMRQPRHAVVAIHDFEVQDYRKAAMSFENHFIFKAYTPQTGIVWNGNKNLAKTLRRLSLLVKTHAKQLEPDDITEWHRVLKTTAPTCPGS